MSDEQSRLNLDRANGSSEAERGGFVALAVIAAAVGAGAALLLAPETGARTRQRVGRGLRNIRGEAAETISQLQREIRRRKHQSRREKQIIGLAGLFIGAGLAAILAPQSGPATRQRLGSTWSRIKVGTVDRIERLRPRKEESGEAGAESEPVRSVQDLGRDPNTVF
jgi:gas vesicle protein